MKRLEKSVTAGLVLIGLLMSTGCRDDYAVSIYNAGERTVIEVSVWYGEYHRKTGWIDPGVSSNHGLVYKPVPEELTVEWKNEGGKSRKQTVSIEGERTRESDLIIEIRDQNTPTARWGIR
ncbi:MAG: hypothetical protein KY459_13430 [Acidobacteria bacterium]|nr:hypothetical protein [Acidobacteriota bacterium]